MPWSAVAGAVASGVIGNMMQGSGGPSSNATQLPNMPEMAQNYQQTIAGYLPQAQQYGGAVTPGFAQQAFNQMYYNPYQAGAQQAGVQAGQVAGQFSPQIQAAGEQALAAGRQAVDAGQQIWQTAQDPQQALYHYLQQQTLDEANAVNSMYGLGGSPAGAAVTNQALSNLDINWQNQQLARQLQGQQALGYGINQLATGAQQGASAGQNAMAFAQQAGALPYQTAQQLAQGQFGAIGAEQAAMQGGMLPYQQNIANIGSYLGTGIGAQQQQLLAQQAQYANQQQNAANIAQMGQSLFNKYQQAHPASTSSGTQTGAGG